NPHRTFLIGCLQPLERGISIPNARIDHSDVYRGDVPSPRYSIQVVKNAQCLYSVARQTVSMPQECPIERRIGKANCLVQFGDRLRKLAGLQVNEAEKPVPDGVIWVEFQSFPARHQSFLVSPRPIENQSKEGIAV